MKTKKQSQHFLTKNERFWSVEFPIAWCDTGRIRVQPRSCAVQYKPVPAWKSPTLRA